MYKNKNKRGTPLLLTAGLILCLAALPALAAAQGKRVAKPKARAAGSAAALPRLQLSERLAGPVPAAPSPAAAEAPEAPLYDSAAARGDLQFHGFVSQGYTLTKGNNVAGSSRDGGGSLQYQEFGLNASWRPRADLLLAGQLASVRAGNATDEYLVLEYALADYTPVQTEHGRFGIRAGKLKLPIGFYNESRDAVFARPSVLLPSMYLDVAGGRSFGYFSQVGAGVYGDAYLGEHALYIEAIGFADQKLGENADIAILRSKATGRFRVDRGVLLRLADDWDGGRARAALSAATVKINYESDPGIPFGPGNLFAQDGDFRFSQAQISLQYNWPQFSLTGEYAWRRFEVEELIPANPFGASFQVNLKPSAAYLQGTWRFTPRWSGFVRYDEEIRDSQDRNGHGLGARFGLPHYYFFAHDWTVGTRYDFSSHLALWGEFHSVDGNIWVNPLDNPGFNEGRAPRHWNLLTLMLGYRF